MQCKRACPLCANSDRESGFPQRGMSALAPESGRVRYGASTIDQEASRFTLAIPAGVRFWPKAEMTVCA